MGESASSRPDGTGRRIAVVVARYNRPVTKLLERGAVEALLAAGVAREHIEVVHVPGAFELPLASMWLSETGRFDAVVALGAVIAGSTDHYDYVCTETAAGILRAGLDTGLPVAFGVLTCDNSEQAFERAGGRVGNKGTDAALTALEMVALRQQLREKSAGPG